MRNGKKDTSITIRLSQELKDALAAKAQREQRDISEMARMILQADVQGQQSQYTTAR